MTKNIEREYISDKLQNMVGENLLLSWARKSGLRYAVSHFSFGSSRHYQISNDSSYTGLSIPRNARTL